MKKLWFGLFAFVLSVCCGFAIVLGSYTRANLIAHSNAYTDLSINDSDDSPYWEQVTITGDATNLNGYGFAYDGKYYFNIDTDNSTLSVFDSSTMSISSVNFVDSVGVTEYEIDFFASNYFYMNDSVYVYDANNGSYFSFTIENGDLIADFTEVEGVVFEINGALYQNAYDHIVNIVNDDEFAYPNDLTYDDIFNYAAFFANDTLFVTPGDEIGNKYLYYIGSDGLVYTGQSFNSFNASYTWYDGYNAYYDNGSTHMIFDTTTYQWVNHSWTGYTGSFSMSNVWSDGNNFYMTTNGTTYMLHVEHPYVSPYPNVLAEMIALMTSGIAGIAEGIGANLSVLAESVMIDANTGNLSAFGSLVIIMCGLALALHLCRCMVNFVSSLGRRDR